jgi:hypothetical protein
LTITSAFDLLFQVAMRHSADFAQYLRRYNMKHSKIALKPYIDAIVAYCESRSKKELTDMIIRLAKDVPADSRMAFLNNIRSCPPGESSITPPEGALVEQILNDIEALKESMEDRIASIENGTYWDDNGNWNDGDDYDDEPDYISEDQADELKSVFDVAEDFFMTDQLGDARKIYEALFDLFRDISHTVNAVPYIEIDIREARARYCRCIYETSEQDKMLDAFADAMEIGASHAFNVNQYHEDYPLLQDVIDVRPEEMEGLESFLPVWKTFLTGKEINGRPAVLLLEAINHLEGIEGVAALARKWKNAQPQGYLFWLNLLKQENDWQRMITVSTEALDAIEASPFREKAALFMIQAAESLKEPKYLLTGKRERFFSNINDTNLLSLVDEAIRQNLRDEEIKTVEAFFTARELKTGESSLYIKALLMMGNLDVPFVMVKNDKGVGWSYGSNAGIVFGAALSVLSGHLQKATTITQLLRTYADARSIYSGKITVEPDNGITFYNEIINGLKQAAPTKARTPEYLAWAESIGKKRIEHIVSNKHRGAYDRAAQTLCSLAEVFLATGETDKAIQLLHTYYHEKYNRFSAFRNEVKAAVKRSELLKNIGF